MDRYSVEMLFWAKEDLLETSKYYENLAFGLGDKFYIEIRSVIDSLEKNPFYISDINGLRQIPVNKFPYKVCFTVDEDNFIVYVKGIKNDHLLPFSVKPKQ